MCGCENEKAALEPRRLFVWMIDSELDRHKYHYAKSLSQLKPGNPLPLSG
jgi:hypothetical protein